MVTVEFVSSDSLIKGYLFPSSGNDAFATVLFLQGFPGVEGDDLVENWAIFDVEKQISYLVDRDILLIGGWDGNVIDIEDHLLPLYRSLKENGVQVKI